MIRTVATMLAYLVLGPPIAALAVLGMPAPAPLLPAAVTAPLGWYLAQAYLAGAAPALITGGAAAALRSGERRARGRIILPALVAGLVVPVLVGGLALAPLGSLPPGGLLVGLGVGGALGALIAGIVAEGVP